MGFLKVSRTFLRWCRRTVHSAVAGFKRWNLAAAMADNAFVRQEPGFFEDPVFLLDVTERYRGVIETINMRHLDGQVVTKDDVNAIIELWSVCDDDGELKDMVFKRLRFLKQQGH